MDKVIAYPNDKPPMVVDPPADYRGCIWGYTRATREDALDALACHRADWSDWAEDDELVALAATE